MKKILSLKIQFKIEFLLPFTGSRKQTLWPLFMDGVQLPQGYKAIFSCNTTFDLI